MKLRFMVHPKTKEQDPMLTMAVLAVLVCLLKFLFEGVTLTLYGHSLSLGHADAMTYGALLAPILGAHGYINTKASAISESRVMKADNPDDT